MQWCQDTTIKLFKFCTVRIEFTLVWFQIWFKWGYSVFLSFVLFCVVLCLSFILQNLPWLIEEKALRATMVKIPETIVAQHTINQYQYQ